MREVFTNEEYDKYMGKIFYGSRFRFFGGCVVLYFVISILFEAITNGLSSVHMYTVIVSHLVGAVIWGALFSLIFISTMKMLLRPDWNTTFNKKEMAYQLSLPCSYKKSAIYSIGGMLYLSQSKLLFRPNKGIIGSKEFKINANETILIHIEQQSVPFFLRLLYKNMFACLVISIGDMSYKFMVPEVTKVIEILEEEGLYKS